MFERILLAVDEGDGADEAVEAVVALGVAFSAEVTVFHVRERTVTPAATLEKESIPQSFAFGEATAGRLVDAGVNASAVVESHEPRHVARSILAKADEIRAELIVIGSHRHSLRNHLFGDIAASLVHRARCPVLLMPTAE